MKRTTSETCEQGQKRVAPAKMKGPQEENFDQPNKQNNKTGNKNGKVKLHVLVCLHCTILRFFLSYWRHGSFVSLRRTSMNRGTHARINSTKQHSNRVRRKKAILPVPPQFPIHNLNTDTNTNMAHDASPASPFGGR